MAEKRPYAAYRPRVAIEEAGERPPADLQHEIALLRQVLLGLFGAELTITDLVHNLNKLSAALARLMRANQQSGEDHETDLGALADRVLSERLSGEAQSD
jgi:hypothetical protein